MTNGLVYTYNYDSNYIPAFPIVEVDIRRVGVETGITLRALVDSGSDVTMIPFNYLRQIKARRWQQARMSNISGLSYPVDTYRVFLQLGPYQALDFMVVADRHNPQMIIGRDVLNHMVVTLNGPASVVEIMQ